MKIKILLSILFLGSIFSHGCFTEKDAAIISPPIPGLEVKPEIFDVDAEQGGVIEIQNGTVITIPSNSFVNAKGEVVKGNVKLHYREFHDAQSIFFSGIPMAYDTLNQKGNLQTAGMFEMRAYQNDEVLKMNPGGEGVEVTMPSFEASRDYNFYKMDDENGEWGFIDNVAPTINKKKVTLLNEIKDLTPKQKFPKDDDCFLFDYNKLLDIRINDPRYKRNVKKADKYGVMWSGVSANEYVVFEGKRTHAALLVWKRIDGKEFPKWTEKRKRGKMLNLTEDGTAYNLNIASTDKTKQYTAKVTPLRKVNKMYAKKLEKWIGEYEKKIAEMDAKQRIAEITASVFRTYKVQGFGFYNWDRKIDPEKEVVVIANFDFAGKELAKEQKIHYVLGENKSVIYHYVAPNMDFRLFTDKDARIVAILPDSTMAVFSPKQHSALDIQALKSKSEKATITFKMSIQPLPTESVLALTEQ